MSIAMVGLSSCNSETARIDNTAWELIQYGEHGNLQAVIEGTNITATFDSDDSQVTGSGGCNTYYGNYEAKNSQLSISGLAWTEMFCLDPEGVMEQEQRFLSALQESESYVIKDGELQISCSDRRVLIFCAK